MTIDNDTDAKLTQILSREISDRITVVNTNLGMNRDFFIDRMEHIISMGARSHKVTYQLSSTTNEDFWCLDYSALDTQSKLGY